ncbi:MAG: hypothetical protein OXP66_14330 [Candidatus Tectomicrobia bacterium]|nr:hypothetical protein [Rhodospirillaceae bacterium]MDE0207188.1 hypothetical protein [Candidatus Tectomicrobia bacterium]
MVANTEVQQSPTLAELGEWLTLIAAIVVVLGALIGGMWLVVAPLYTEIQAVNGRLDRMETEIRAGREESKAVRADIAELSERLTRVEILLEQRGGAGPQEPPG